MNSRLRKKGYLIFHCVRGWHQGCQVIGSKRPAAVDVSREVGASLQH